ncbi:COPI associated [Dissoconium aciculare CBS 342.82]|uniref:COPI associated n=1 Tax=Dissoconium aciculare CBS 342.82 TaxID=1314786 RepID=A0A6J3M1C5_9PEZI|nr:COPI associated [Dissoconium aciculare CBS 342.82]KAF1821688.1 COPI associated [Dissoconium aciculare CBS 342.82]
MDFSDIFRIVNLATGVFMLLGGISQFFPAGIKGIIVGIFLIIFGSATALLEFQIPPQTARYASFMFSFLGRGAFYLFIGAIAIGEKWYNIVPGSLTALVGLAYIALEFVPQIEPPANMRDADAGWGAEQV